MRCTRWASSGTFHAAVNLPDGSVVTLVIMGCYNQSSLINIVADFEEITYRSFAVAVNVLSGTEAGFHTATQATNDTIDNSAHMYQFTWSPDSSGKQEPWYIRVDYVPPAIFGVALPLVRH